MSKHLTAAALVLASAGFMTVATANTTNFAGTLSLTDPVFNRPVAGNPPIILSPTGTAVSYDVFPFFVNAVASFTLQTLTANLFPIPAQDTFMVLYQTAFNPASPLINALQADDDNGVGALSLITRSLVPGVQYYMVITTFNNSALGDYTGSIFTPGTEVAILGAVPEPSTALLMLGGLGLAGFFAARRRQRA